MGLVFYHWPRYIPAVLFVLYSLQQVKDKYTFLRKMGLSIVLFFISAPVVSVISEILSSWFFDVLLHPHVAYSNAVFFSVHTTFILFYDAIAFVIPLILYAKILDKPFVLTSTWFMQFALQDRFALLLSPNQIGYLIVYFVGLVIIFLVHGNEFMYINSHLDALNWKPVLIVYILLFFLMDSCYSAVYYFQYTSSEDYAVLVIWIDSIVVLACAFAAGFAKLNAYLSSEQIKQINYMRRFQESQSDIIREFATVSEAKTGETGQHIRRVSEYTAIMGKELLDDTVDIEMLKVASMMHDVGKLMIPSDIIEKPTQLTVDEYEIVKRHSAYGSNLLSHGNSFIMTIAREIAYQHHERWDGKGYPQGLKGDEISIYAQIVAVADVYDTLTNRRSYKKPWPADRARTEIIIQRGQQFSPRVVDVFDKCYDQIEEIRLKFKDEPLDEPSE